MQNVESIQHQKQHSILPVFHKTDNPLPASHIEEFIQPRNLAFQKSTDVLSLLEPKCIPSNPLSSSIDSLLEMLKTQPSSVKRIEPKEQNHYQPIKKCELQEQITLADLHLHLPSYGDIKSHSSSFYNCSTSSMETSSHYMNCIQTTCYSVIEYSLYSAMSLYMIDNSIMNSLFTEYIKQGHSPSNTDTLPSLTWLHTCSFSHPQIAVYSNCSLTIKNTEFSKKRKRYEPLDTPRYFLTIPSMKSSTKKTDDSSSLLNNLFVLLLPSQVCFFRCLWHGVTSNQSVELSALSSVSITSTQHITVINCGSIDMEVKVLQRLSSFPSLLLSSSLINSSTVQRSKPFLSWSSSELHSYQVEYCEKFGLNECQMEVFDRVNTALTSPSFTPLLLVKGVFGSGKSHLIAVLLSFLYSLQERTGQSIRLLFCSHTNTAVDRVCFLLKEGGFTSFRRMGNIRKIHPQLRSFYGNRKDHEEDENVVIATTLCSLSDTLTNTDIVIMDETSQVTEYYVGVFYKQPHSLGTPPHSTNQSNISSINRR